MSEHEHKRAAGTIRWIERSLYLHEARITTADGADLYAGYVAVTPGADVWHGYVGRGFVPLGMGPRTVMQRAVALRVAEIMQRGGEDVYHPPRQEEVTASPPPTREEHHDG